MLKQIPRFRVIMDSRGLSTCGIPRADHQYILGKTFQAPLNKVTHPKGSYYWCHFVRRDKSKDRWAISESGVKVLPALRRRHVKAVLMVQVVATVETLCRLWIPEDAAHRISGSLFRAPDVERTPNGFRVRRRTDKKKSLWWYVRRRMVKVLHR